MSPGTCRLADLAIKVFDTDRSRPGDCFGSRISDARYRLYVNLGMPGDILRWLTFRNVVTHADERSSQESALRLDASSTIPNTDFLMRLSVKYKHG